MLKLTSLFDVTSDYLLGYSNKGIGVNFNDAHEYISAVELEKLKERYNVKETLIKVEPSDFVVRSVGQAHRLYRNEYVIFREVDENIANAGVSSTLRDKINAELDTLDSDELEKVLKFIKEYIR